MKKMSKLYSYACSYSSDHLKELLGGGLKKDLHNHSCYSDGALTPRALIDRRVSEGFELMAITDHDGIEGSKLGAEYAGEAGIGFVSGIEFDSEDPLGKDMHILGYGFDYDAPALRGALSEIVKRRAARNRRFLDALNSRGFGITEEDIYAVNEGRYVGKPTFAVILTKKGITDSVQQAFSTIFREDDLRAIKKETLATKDVIDVIHESGGLAVMAHPMEQRRLRESFEDFKPRLFEIMDRVRSYGIDGIECRHPSASAEQQEMLAGYTEAYGLLITEGSDYHSDFHKRDFSIYHRP